MTDADRQHEADKAATGQRTLTRWNPLAMGDDAARETITTTFEGETPSSTMLVDLKGAMATQRNLATLYRAAELNGLLRTLFMPDGQLNGQPWYDRIERIIAMDIEATVDNEKLDFTWTDDQNWKDEQAQQIVNALRGENIEADDWTTLEIGENAVAENIVVRLLVETEFETVNRRLRTDFGVGTEFTTEVCNAGILVSHDSQLQIEALRSLITDAIHEYDWDDRNDSRETQRRECIEAAHTVAARLLLPESEAQAESIRHAALCHLCHLLPENQTVELRKRPTQYGDKWEIEVRVMPADADAVDPANR